MDVRSLRRVLAFVGGTGIGLAWIHWGLSPTIIVVFIALVLIDMTLWIRQKHGDERPPQIGD
jgi:predicted small integral membrane protein